MRGREEGGGVIACRVVAVAFGRGRCATCQQPLHRVVAILLLDCTFDHFADIADRVVLKVVGENIAAARLVMGDPLQSAVGIIDIICHRRACHCHLGRATAGIIERTDGTTQRGLNRGEVVQVVVGILSNHLPNRPA